MDEIEIEIIKRTGEPPLLSYDDVLKILNNNRDKIRTLSNLILTVSGFLLSAWFVILFFLIEYQNQSNQITVIALILAGTILLLLSIIFSVLSAMLPSPKTVVNKLVLIDTINHIYHREFRFIKLAIVFLISSISTFLFGLFVFLYQSI